MRIFPILTALLVATALYFVITDRESVFALLNQASGNDQSDPEPTQSNAPVADDEDLVKVVVQRSEAQAIETAVALRGETLAARTVDVRSETSAIVVSEPLRKGTEVSEGQILCRLDESTRDTDLKQARALLEEALARAPEAEARLEQSRAELNEAEINLNASAKLIEGGLLATTCIHRSNNSSFIHPKSLLSKLICARLTA